MEPLHAATEPETPGAMVQNAQALENLGARRLPTALLAHFGPLVRGKWRILAPSEGPFCAARGPNKRRQTRSGIST